MLRAMLDRAGARDVAAAVLRRRPLVRRAPGSALEYRAVSLDNLLVAREIFDHGEYAAVRRFGPIQSFIDLGCNAGYFTVFMAGQGDPSTIRGLSIDAHPQMVEQTRWHVEHNRLANVHAAWGLAGAAGAQEGNFFLHVDAAGSSQYPRAPESHVARNPWRQTTVPVISVGETWTRLFGDAECDVLKVDIEGSEDAFLRGEAVLLKRVGALLVEAHRWLVDVPSLEHWLSGCGFDPVETLRADADVQVGLYVNRAGRFAAHARQSPVAGAASPTPDAARAPAAR